MALVGPSFPPQVGGIELHLARLAENLGRLGCQVDVLVQSRHSDAPAERVEHPCAGVRVRRFRSWTHSHRFPVAPGMAACLLREHGLYDVVHGHSFHASAAPMAALVTHNPFVYTPHYHAEGHTRTAQLLHRFYAPIGRRTFDRAEAVICNSHSEAELVRRDFAIAEDRLRILLPGVDVDALRGADPWPGEPETILSAGRIEGYKQIHKAIEAVARLDRRVQMVVIGQGPVESELRGLAERLGASTRVRFLGRLPEGELHRWLRTASVVVGLSRHEAFGLLQAEGLVAGARCVMSDIPAHREVAAFGGSATRFVGIDSGVAEIVQALEEQLEAGPVAPDTVRVPTWADLARACLRTYEEAMSNPRRQTKRAARHG